MLLRPSAAGACRTRALARRLRFSTAAARTDAECAAALQANLASHYENSLPTFEPMWESIASAVADNHLHPSAILDLASGSGDGAVALARRFPAAHVVVSDSSEEERERAEHKVHALGLADRVSIEPIDLASMHVFAHVADEGGAEADALPRVDVVTCSLGLYLLPPAQHAGLLKGIRTLLAPGGLLVASVWEPPMPLIEMGHACLAAAIGEHATAPPLPFEPTSLCVGSPETRTLNRTPTLSLGLT
jgi:SAM-dependent methyltransferase